jgi:hypothetical protein
MRRTIVTVRWDKNAGCWAVKVRNVDGTMFLTDRETKTVAVEEGRHLAKGKQPSQLRVFNKNGRIQTEHTYPRSSDPRRYKG